MEALARVKSRDLEHAKQKEIWLNQENTYFSVKK